MRPCVPVLSAAPAGAPSKEDGEGWTKASGRIAFKPVSRNPELEKQRYASMLLNSGMKLDMTQVERRWARQGAAVGEGKTGSGPIGVSGILKVGAVEIVSVMASDDAMLLPVRSEPAEVKRVPKAPDLQKAILLAEGEAIKKASALREDLDRDVATHSGATSPGSKVLWPIVWTPKHAFVFGRDDDEDIEITICRWGTPNPLFILSRLQAITRFRKNYENYVHAGDAPRFVCKTGHIADYEWTFCDGSKTKGDRVKRFYERAGQYSEIVKVTNSAGDVAYDFAVVYVIDRENTERVPPAIHANYYPTFNLRAGDEVTFKVRSFATRHGREVWDFGDKSAPVTVQSDGNADQHNPAGYAIKRHRYREAGDYIVTVRRSDENGYEAVGHLHVRID